MTIITLGFVNNLEKFCRRVQTAERVPNIILFWIIHEKNQIVNFKTKRNTGRGGGNKGV